MSTISLNDLESRLEGMFSRIPNLPADIKDIIVEYGPYLILAAGALFILTSGIINLYTFGLIPRGLLGIALPTYYLTIVFSIIMGIILITSFAPLKRKQRRGWQTLFYFTLIYAMISLLTLRIFISCFLLSAPIFCFR
jgi:hypothetical protein